jgi:hypothetical protein
MKTVVITCLFCGEEAEVEDGIFVCRVCLPDDDDDDDDPNPWGGRLT